MGRKLSSSGDKVHQKCKKVFRCTEYLSDTDGNGKNWLVDSAGTASSTREMFLMKLYFFLEIRFNPVVQGFSTRAVEVAKHKTSQNHFFRFLLPAGNSILLLNKTIFRVRFPLKDI